MRHIRLTLNGLVVDGQGFIEILATKQEYLKQRYDTWLSLVGVASARSGFIHRVDGLNLLLLQQLAREGRPLAEHPGVKHWSSALEGLQATASDVLIEASPTNLRDAEPALSHIRAALSKNMHVVTANKGPGALAAHELLALAKLHGVQLRMESSVMAGTPVMSTMREGMMGARIIAIRGILNGTTNYILSAMAAGRDYAEALAETQARGLAETDPTADVEGFDAVAKTMILAAFVFNHPLRVEQVERQGITAITHEEVQAALDAGQRIKLVASLSQAPDSGELTASVKPQALPLNDALAHVNGALNAISIQADTLPEVTIIGPGAGRIETAQGLLEDVLACAYRARL